MRRAALTLGGTAAGIAALVAVKFHPATSNAAAIGTMTPSATAPVPAQGTPASGTGATPRATAKPRATTTTTKPSGTGGSGQSTATRVITGSVASTQYGPMQVQVTLASGKITKITVLQQTNVGGQSSQIDAMAIPKLTSEALAAQSAKIDAVSGASYTSQGYIQSLQSALDKA